MEDTVYKTIYYVTNKTIEEIEELRKTLKEDELLIVLKGVGEDDRN